MISIYEIPLLYFSLISDGHKILYLPENKQKQDGFAFDIIIVVPVVYH